MSKRDTHIRRQAVRHVVDARRKFEGDTTTIKNSTAPIAAATRERLVKIEGLLREGRDAEAILLANVGAWSDQACADRIGKRISIQASRVMIVPRNGRRLALVLIPLIWKMFNIEGIFMILWSTISSLD